MNPYKIHGICQVIAFAVLFPLGALIAVFRNQIGPGWLKWHIIFQLSASVFVLIAASAIGYAVWKNWNMKQNKSVKNVVEDETFTDTMKGKEDEDASNEKVGKEHKFMSWHKLIGGIVVLLVFFQLAWAYIGKRLVEWNIWLLVHTALASLIILGGWTNIYIAWKMH